MPTELVIRHRGAGRDENGQITSASNVELPTLAIAPGGGSEFVERGRDGEKTEFTVYFALGTDVNNDDSLTVRGQTFGIVVNEWRSPWTGRGGLEVLCTRGQG